MSDPLTRQDKYGKIPSWNSSFRGGGGGGGVLFNNPNTWPEKYRYTTCFVASTVLTSTLSTETGVSVAGFSRQGVKRAKILSARLDYMLLSP